MRGGEPAIRRSQALDLQRPLGGETGLQVGIAGGVMAAQGRRDLGVRGPISRRRRMNRRAMVSVARGDRVDGRFSGA